MLREPPLEIFFRHPHGSPDYHYLKIASLRSLVDGLRCNPTPTSNLGDGETLDSLPFLSALQLQLLPDRTCRCADH